MFLIAVTIPFDVRDLPFDSKTLKTIPQIIGEKNSIRLSLFLLFLSSVLVSLHCFSKGISQLIAPALIAQFISGLVILKTTANRPKIFFTGLIDGLLFIQGVLTWVFSASLC